MGSQSQFDQVADALAGERGSAAQVAAQEAVQTAQERGYDHDDARVAGHLHQILSGDD
jgi:hypothetical protein